MVLIAILGLIAILLILFIIAAVSIGGAAFILIFGDVIVCVLFISWLIKKILKRRKRA